MVTFVWVRRMAAIEQFVCISNPEFKACERLTVFFLKMQHCSLTDAWLVWSSHEPTLDRLPLGYL